MTMPTTRTIPTIVGNLAVRIEGAGPATVLWHSLFVDDRSWDVFAEPLTAERRLIRITGPCHGESEATTRRFSQEDCAAAAVKVLDELSLHDPVDWVGNAWGGHVGILVAAQHPEHVRSLVTLGTPIEAYTASERAKTSLLVALYRVFGPAKFVVGAAAGVLLSARTRSELPAALAYVQECLRTADRAALINAIRSISLDRPDVTPELSRITAPTLIVTSPDHPGFTPAQAAAAVHALPRGELAIVEGPAYLAPLEAPESTRDIVRAFWKRTAADAA